MIGPLTVDQAKVVDAAVNGHNIFLTGQAGSGKSYVVNAIFHKLRESCKSVSIITSTGLAGTIYKDLSTHVKTVHSCYGLAIAELPFDLVVERSIRNNLVLEWVNSTDCIIWDEISMSSMRIFHLVNKIHATLAKESDSMKPFGGKQIILVGEFLQLQPVPNIFDRGMFVLHSTIFQKWFPHRFELKSIMRQDPTETVFMECLKELRLGTCSEKSSLFLSTLSRDISAKPDAVHIYFKRRSVQVHNLNMLFSQPGQLFKFDAIKEGNTQHLKCPAEETLLLQTGCPVMLLWNISDNLKNGTVGVFVGDQDNNILVDFPHSGKISLSRKIWHKRSQSGQVVGSLTKFPVILNYATTCHKCQGTTLPAAVVHCSKEFVSGLIYVALSRVQHSSNIQIIDFNPNQLMPAKPECVNVCSIEHCSEVPADGNYQCCRAGKLTDNDMGCKEEFEDQCLEDEGVVAPIVPNYLVDSYFERGEPDEQAVDLETMFVLITESCDADLLLNPPLSFEASDILKEMKVKDPKTTFSTGKNELIDSLLPNAQQTELFGKILWVVGWQLILEHAVKSLDQVQISKKKWTEISRQLYLYITRSATYMQHLKLFFNSSSLTKLQMFVGAELMERVYKNIVNFAAQKVREQEVAEPIVCNVRDMSPAGLAKIRHVGAWSVAKVLNSQRKYVRENMTSSVHSTRKSVQERHEMCLLLEENIIANFHVLEEKTLFPETLKVTEERQYRHRGLTHIEDRVYEFFVELEIARVCNINREKLAQHKEETVHHALKNIEENEDVKRLWIECFPHHLRQSKQALIEKLFVLICERYVNVGAGQYMKDLRQAHRLRKSAEHRKKVLQRKEKMEQKKASVSYADILADDSEGKIRVHHRLMAFLNKFGEIAFANAYLKPQLQNICNAYGVTNFNTKTNKKELVKLLVPCMRASQCILHPFYVSNMRVTSINDEGGRMTMRIQVTR